MTSDNTLSLAQGGGRELSRGAAVEAFEDAAGGVVVAINVAVAIGIGACTHEFLPFFLFVR